jgi:hypothetical protein
LLFLIKKSDGFFMSIVFMVLNKTSVVSATFGRHTTRFCSVFEFPDILRQPSDYALKLFVQHESVIVPTYYVFLLSALTAIPLSIALVRFFASNEAASKGNFALLSLGTATAIFQAIGFSRWVFTIPMIAHAYFAPNTSEPSKQALALMYDTLNRYLGMTVGEHLGFLSMGAWTMVLAWQFGKAGGASARVSRILVWTGYATGVLTILSAGEHFGGGSAPFFAVLNIIANTVWIFWLVALAIVIWRFRDDVSAYSNTSSKGI